MVSLAPVCNSALAANRVLAADELRMDVRYEVEKILEHRGVGRKLEYLVRWAKWPTPTWEPFIHLIGANEALADYERRKGKKGAGWYGEAG